MSEVFGYDPEALGLKRGKYAGVKEVHVCCPFHGGSGKSASFNIATGKFYCYKCRASASAERIAQHCGGTVVRKHFTLKLEDDLDNWNDLLKNAVDPNNAYLHSRGVTSEQILKYKIRDTDKGVAIPISDFDGKEVGAIIRQTGDYIRYLYGGMRLPLWPLQSLRNYPSNERLYVVEGVFGVLRGEKFGHNVVATLGAMIKREVREYLRHFSDIVVVFDHDDAGYLGGARLLKQIPHARVRVPGAAVDELDASGWKELGDGKLTRDIGVIRNFVNNKEMFERFGGR